MARKTEATPWMLVKIGGRTVMKRLVKKGRSYVPRVEDPYEAGSYHLRYTQHRKRKWEWVGSDLTLALQVQKAHPRALEASTEPAAPSVPLRKALREHVSRFAAKKDGVTKTARRRANTWRSFLAEFSKWWSREYIDEFQRQDFDLFRKHLASTGKTSRTQSNLLSNLLTFLRAGRLVRVVRTEDDLKIQTAYLAQLGFQDATVVVKSDFPRVVKNRRPSYYAAGILEALFAAAESWEVLFLALFLFTGMREDEIAHLYRTNVLWHATETEVKDKPEGASIPKPTKHGTSRFTGPC
jgi:hypothetical protein